MGLEFVAYLLGIVAYRPAVRTRAGEFMFAGLETCVCTRATAERDAGNSANPNTMAFAAPPAIEWPRIPVRNRVDRASWRPIAARSKEAARISMVAIGELARVAKSAARARSQRGVLRTG